MMQFFRKYGAPVFAVAAFTVLVWMVFSLSGLTGSGTTSNQNVGKINGTAIPTRAYLAAVDQAINQRQREGGSLTADETEALREQVWEQFIQQRVLESQFDRRGIMASADEVAEALKNQPPPEFLNVPDFQTEGKFDLAKYQRWLQSSVAQQYIPGLEQSYRDAIRQRKLLQMLTADVYLSDAALWQRYQDSHETVKIEVVAVIPVTAVSDSAVPLTEAEVTQYYTQHRDDFKRPRVAYLSYVSLPHLADASDSAAALSRAQAVRAEIVAGAPFAEVAHRESADTATATKGGDLGEWTRGSYDPAFEAVAFSIPLNAISQPVLSPLGYHLIQVTERKGDKAKSRHILIPVVVTGTHRERVDAQADSLEQLGAEHLDPAALDTAARVLGLRIGQANPLAQGEQVHLGVRTVPDAAGWAFRAQPGETSSIVEAGYAYFLFRLDSVHAAGVPPLSQIRGEVEIAARNAKKRGAAQELAKQLEQRLASGTSLAQAAADLKVVHREFGPFTRLSPPISDPLVVGAAFGLQPGAQSGVIDSETGFYIVRTLTRVPADSADFAKNLTEFRTRQSRQAQEERVQNFMTSWRSAAKVEDRRSDVLRTAAQAGGS
jgi:peptidyl-prolyl cis-trans isomerase D